MTYIRHIAGVKYKYTNYILIWESLCILMLCDTAPMKYFALKNFFRPVAL
jgi:hypothetical protein